MNVFINNDDVVDLFVTVTDNNTQPPSNPLTNKRINHGGASVGIDVQADGDGNANLGWFAQSAEDPTKTKTNANPVTPSAGQTVDVDVFGA